MLVHKEPSSPGPAKYIDKAVSFWARVSIDVSLMVDLCGFRNTVDSTATVRRFVQLRPRMTRKDTLLFRNRRQIKQSVGRAFSWFADDLGP